jgi:hypothetical protein
LRRSSAPRCRLEHVSDQQQPEDFVDQTPDHVVTERNHGKWAPGYSGNPAGRPKKKYFRDEILRQLDEHPEDLKQIVSSLIAAAKGEQTNRFSEIVNQGMAAQFVKETLDGRAKQEVEVTGEDGGPIGFVIVPESKE